MTLAATSLCRAASFHSRKLFPFVPHEATYCSGSARSPRQPAAHSLSFPADLRGGVSSLAALGKLRLGKGTLGRQAFKGGLDTAAPASPPARPSRLPWGVRRPLPQGCPRPPGLHAPRRAWVRPPPPGVCPRGRPPSPSPEGPCAPDAPSASRSASRADGGPDPLLRPPGRPRGSRGQAVRGGTHGAPTPPAGRVTAVAQRPWGRPGTAAPSGRRGASFPARSPRHPGGTFAGPRAPSPFPGHHVAASCPQGQLGAFGSGP